MNKIKLCIMVLLSLLTLASCGENVGKADIADGNAEAVLDEAEEKKYHFRDAR